MTQKPKMKKLTNGTLEFSYEGMMGNETWYLRPDGSIYSNANAAVTLEKEDGKWVVRFSMDKTFAQVLDILKDEMGEFDLSGTLEGPCCGPFGDCAEGLAQSDPLTDEQAEKIRDYFIPSSLKEIVKKNAVKESAKTPKKSSH